MSPRKEKEGRNVALSLSFTTNALPISSKRSTAKISACVD